MEERREQSRVHRALRAGRPDARPEFVHQVASRVTGHGVSLRRGRLIFAVALATAIAAVAASVGGPYATDASTDALNALTRVSSKKAAPRLAVNTPAQHQYREKCNSGRGNLSETESGTRQTDSSTLTNPHTGGRGPGQFPTDDCDPGNSGPQNRGGD
jgi:hypothetical protein